MHCIHNTVFWDYPLYRSNRTSNRVQIILRGYNTDCNEQNVLKPNAEIWASVREFRALRRLDDDPGTSARRTAAAEGIDVATV